MVENQAKIELEKAYGEFLAQVEEAKKSYHQKIDEILKKIDEMKIGQVKKNLNI